ncbi:hypothetical protein FLBR109950_03845 [Flavobacterium branchiophilum]|uniref:Lipoprotein n=1 Tax=Flavobacterium branchiophilum (strain FL-15) TaxID=1034807 RepID=G2Z417_FLABF|nr:hypothetical protein [Flavobacterium branchiophilum]CCB68353.1 Hypothetical protein FBFL15_0204 [Flavobacterium branchiophilum FL-15]
MKSIKKNVLFYFLILILFNSCKKSTVINFDEVYYYKYFFNVRSEVTSPRATKFMNICNNDTVFDKKDYLNLQHFGFKGKRINNQIIYELNSIFVNKKELVKEDYKCLNAYCDILVFLRQKQIVGVAKFDFKCNNCMYNNFDNEIDNVFIKNNCSDFEKIFKKAYEEGDNIPAVALTLSGSGI